MAGLNGGSHLSRGRIRLELGTVLTVILLGLLLVLIVYPLVLLFISSFQIADPGQPASFGYSGWVEALTDPGIRSSIVNTFTLMIVHQSIALVIAVFISWLIARTDLPWKSSLELGFWISFFLPTLPVVLAWVLISDPDFGLINQLILNLFPNLDKGPFNIYSWWGIVWVHLVTSTIGIKVMILTPAFKNLDGSFEEASYTVGDSMIGALRKIVIPILLPAISVVTLMSVMRALESFEIELFLGIPIGLDVYTTKIYRLIHQDPPHFSAATALSVLMIVAMIPLILLQRWIGQRNSYSTVSSHYNNTLLQLGRWKWPAFIFVFIVVSFITIVPFLFLVLSTFMSYFGLFSISSPWTLSNWKMVLSDDTFVSSLFNTIGIGIGVVILSILLCIPIAYIAVKTKIRFRSVIDFISWLPFTLPGIILGLAFLWMTLEVPFMRPLYGTIFSLIIVVTLSAMTLNVQIAKSSLAQIDRELEESSWVSGGSWMSTFKDVLFPLISQTVIVIGLVSFISAARNVSQIVLISTNKSMPLSLLQLNYMVDGRYEAGAVIGLIVVLMTIVVALCLRKMGAKIFD